MVRVDGRNGNNGPKRPRQRVEVNDLRRLSLWNRQNWFSKQEADSFNQRIRDFWENAKRKPSLISIDRLHALERDLISMVGAPGDHKRINLCRRKILESLRPEERTKYINLLLTLSSLYYKRGEFADSEEILEMVMVGDAGNWHVLKELAIVHGKEGKIDLALTRFAQAREILEKYREQIEIEEAEELEADAYEASFRAVALINKRDASQEEIFTALEPLFQLPQKLTGAEKIYSRLLAGPLQAFVESIRPVGDLAYVFGRRIEGELEEQTEMGRLPVRLHLAAQTIAHDLWYMLTMGKVYNAFEKVEAGLGEEAVALVAFIRAEDILAKRGWTAAKGFLEEVDRMRFVLGKVIQGIKAQILRHAREKISEEKGIEVIEQLDGVREERINLEQAYEAVAQKITTALREIEAEDQKETLRDEIVDVIEELIINNSSSLRGVSLLANALWEVDADLQKGLRDCFERTLAEEEVGERVCAMLQRIRNTMAFVAEQLVKEQNQIKVKASKEKVKISPIKEKQKRLKIIKVLLRPPNTSDFKKFAKIYDLFCVRLRDLAVFKEIFKKVAMPHAQPVNLLSTYYGLLAGYAADPEIAGSLANPHHALALLEESVGVDGNNITSRIGHARALGNVGRFTEANQETRALMAGEVDPLVFLRAATIRVATTWLEAERMIKKPGHQDAALKLMAEARKLYDKTDAVHAEQKEAYGDWDFFNEDRALTVCNMAALHALAHDFERAHELYDTALREDRLNEAAIKGKSYLFLMEGNFFEATIFCGRVNELGAKDDPFLYFCLAESLLQMEYYDEARGFISGAPAGICNHALLKLADARRMVKQGHSIGAELIFERVAKALEEDKNRLQPEVVRGLSGDLKLTEAEILRKKGKGKEAEAAYRKAIDYFSQDFYTEYKEMETRRCLAHALTVSAIERRDDRLLKKALKEAEILVEKYPFYVPGRHEIIGILVKSGENEKALVHLRWIIERDLMYLTHYPLANLIIIASLRSGSQAAAKQAAKELLRSLEGSIPRDIVELAERLIYEVDPDFEIAEEVQSLYAAE